MRWMRRICRACTIARRTSVAAVITELSTHAAEWMGCDDSFVLALCLSIVKWSISSLIRSIDCNRFRWIGVSACDLCCQPATASGAKKGKTVNCFRNNSSALSLRNYIVSGCDEHTFCRFGRWDCALFLFINCRQFSRRAFVDDVTSILVALTCLITDYIGSLKENNYTLVRSRSRRVSETVSCRHFRTLWLARLAHTQKRHFIIARIMR